MAIDLPGLYQYRNQLIEHMYIDTYFNGKFFSTNKHPRYDEMKEAYDEIEKMIEEKEWKLSYINWYMKGIITYTEYFYLMGYDELY